MTQPHKFIHPICILRVLASSKATILSVCPVCSSLQQPDGTYSAAHLLEHGHLERAGRASKSTASQKPTLTAEAPPTTVVAAASSSDLDQHPVPASIVSVEAAESPQTLAVARGATVEVTAVIGSGRLTTEPTGAGVSQRRHTAAVVVIGDEILSGKVRVHRHCLFCHFISS